jgi:hypothetical protein
MRTTARHGSDDRSGLRVLAEAHYYLRHLVALVLLLTIAATFVIGPSRPRSKAASEKGPGLGSFFAVYYVHLA